MVGVFPNLMKTLNPQIQESQGTLSTRNEENYTAIIPQ